MDRWFQTYVAEDEKFSVIEMFEKFSFQINDQKECLEQRIL